MRLLGCFVLTAVIAGGSAARAEAGDDGDAGDVRPVVRAILEAARAAPGSPTLAEALGRSAARPAIELTPPATIRVWRRRVDGSTASCSGRVDVIAFEDYVKGVLPHEWIPTWDDRALEMGALCVRSFAWFLVKAGGKYDCADVDDTTASQVYGEDRRDKTDAAVERTRGMAIVRDGSLVMAEYSAENGSPTAFGVDEPHCTGKPVNGHGRGTCQWGTQRWATIDGKGYAWMTSHYYPGATVLAPTAALPQLAALVIDLEAPSEIVAGEQATVTVELQNGGAAAWDSRVRLGTREPSPFMVAGAWIDATRVVAVGDVAPGERARVTFAIAPAASLAAGDYRETLELVRDGATAEWFGGEAVTLPLRVVAAAVDPDDAAIVPRDDGELTGGCQVGAAPGPSGSAALLAVLMVLRRLRRRRGRRTPPA